MAKGRYLNLPKETSVNMIKVIDISGRESSITRPQSTTTTWEYVDSEEKLYFSWKFVPILKNLLFEKVFWVNVGNLIFLPWPCVTFLPFASPNRISPGFFQNDFRFSHFSLLFPSFSRQSTIFVNPDIGKHLVGICMHILGFLLFIPSFPSNFLHLISVWHFTITSLPFPYWQIFLQFSSLKIRRLKILIKLVNVCRRILKLQNCKKGQ